MTWLRPIAAALALAASPARSDDAAATANRVMREALLERAPLPTRPPALPDRSVPGSLVKEHVAEANTDAERTARQRAARHAVNESDAQRIEAANRAAMAPMMKGCMGAGAATGCADPMPADMMKSRGTMPGGAPMPGGMSGGPGGMPAGGGMPRDTTSSPASGASQPPGGPRR